MHKFRKFYSKPVIFILFAIGVLTIIYMQKWYVRYLRNFSELSGMFLSDKKCFRGEKIVHLDLKGGPFKVSYYKELFPLLSNLGATGLLLEYEDTFPYSGPLLGNISAYNAYTLTDIDIIIAYAKKYNLSLIPLVPTFSHMEFILKLREFRNLREDNRFPQFICPTNEKTLDLIMEMIQQIVQAHPGIDKLHIGSNKVWFVKECSRCKNFLIETGLTKRQLFLKCIMTVVGEIHKRHPKLRVLMWDDYFRIMTVKDLSEIGSLIEPVVWDYTPRVDERWGSDFWSSYSQVFRKIWIASAFKGVTGNKNYLHNATYHYENHRSWLRIVDNYKDIVQFEGIFLTGQQRNNHFSVLSELLPACIPTLGVCLGLFANDKLFIVENTLKLNSILGCLQHNLSMKTTPCSYPGSDIFKMVLKYHNIRTNFQEMLNNTEIQGLIDTYNIKNDYSNPYYIEVGLANLETIKTALVELQSEIYFNMAPIYDNYTIIEWTTTYVEPLLKDVDSLFRAKQMLLSKNHWPKRPLYKDSL